MANTLSEGTGIVERLPVNDLNLGTFLFAMGYELASISVDKSDMEFVFKDVPERVILDYANDKKVVPPKRMLEAFKHFRTLTRTIGRSSGTVKMPSPPKPTIPIADAAPATK